MRVIVANSVNEALATGLLHLNLFALEEPSRNGPVLVSRVPVMTLYAAPNRRVLINEHRDANPFFHLFESLWMLAGRNDLAFPATFVKDFGKFSDDGKTLWGAYGYRWRHYFGYDQLETIVEELKRDPTTRRAVLSMWDGGVFTTGQGINGDLAQAMSGGKDVPCNTHAYFDTIGGKLNMTVCCRSNDIILGAYGANAVHFSVLLEYVAAATGLPMGMYRQFSNNFHAYTELYPAILPGRSYLSTLATSVRLSDPYGRQGHMAMSFDNPVITPMPLVAAGEEAAEFLQDCEWFCDHFTENNFQTRFFSFVVCPMYQTWLAWKDGNYEDAKHLALQIRADDWRLAAQSWLSIREQRRQEKVA